MTLSRITPALFALLSVSAAAAPPIDAERAMRNYRTALKPLRELDCPKPSADEIVVCGRDPSEPDPNRLPLPVEREPGAPVAGEPLADGGGCIRLCPQPVMIDLIGAGKAIAGGVKRILEGDE